MNENFLKDFLNTIVFLIPILGLVWKGAKISARLDELERKVEENIGKFCKDHREMQSELDEEKEYRLNDTQELKDILNKIQQSIVRLETKIELSEK
ncbi:MAG: hypothetical protein IIV96_04065 [Ruminococcus sp.]|nr:hypothetical protein [Ruminococcus sp.]